jgi:hypothetical protein
MKDILGTAHRGRTSYLVNRSLRAVFQREGSGAVTRATLPAQFSAREVYPAYDLDRPPEEDADSAHSLALLLKSWGLL